ncbi:hypothetical protein HK100_007842 [Physocladia obscura]|uniref:G domain-containing protein n=1 Tax=Physocladia obscura TaxID=109957 RepID=A0AAD5T4M5_9FUNG|nr:hypothetical protein HK100_007842 [Physocladia obscura]
MLRFCKAVEFANICLRDLSSLRLSRNVGAMRNVVSRMGYVSPKRQRMINRHPTKGLEIESAVNSQIESVLRNGKKWKKCRGCAAPIQCIDANKPGFIPAELLIGNSGSRVPSVHTRALTAIPVEAKLPEMGFNPQQLMILVDEVAERAKKKRKEEKLVCQRCHSLIHYNTNTSNVISVDAAASLIDKHLVSAPAVAVVVIDAADLPFSLPPTSLLRNVNPSAQIFALNKIDLLSSIHEKPDIINERMVKVQKYVSKMIFPYTSAKIIPISARSGFGLMELVDAINSSHESLLAADKSSPNLSNNQVLPNITFLGRPNTGKSKLINILSEMSSDVRFPRQHNTSSIHPGTTIGLIPRPLSQFYLLAQLCTQENSKKQFVYDTPGLFHPDQITQHMSTAELSTSIPCKPFQPKAAIKLAPGTSMFVGALLRIDCVLRDAPPAVFRIRNFIEPVGDNKKKRTHEEKLVGSLTSKGFYRNSEVFISAYIANLIPLHKCRTERAAELFDKAGSYPDIMYPPIGADRAKIFGEMKYVERFRGDQFGSGKAIDIAIGGVGWVTLRNIPQNYDFDVWVLGTSGSAVIRESIIG